MKDSIIDEKEDYKYIRLNGFDNKLFEEEDDGGTRDELFGHLYLEHLIQLWPWDWVNKSIGGMLMRKVTIRRRVMP